MAEELEVLWQRLKVTEEEEESISLGDECMRAAVERGKKCVFMKVLSRKGLMVEALRKNIRMLWKPNKSIQLSVIGEELFLVEFEDERDKRRVMDMRPWHYEKQLVLFKEFEGDESPKDILLKWSPFWVQIYNLPLKSRTKETGKAIGESIGKFIEVDVEETGVQWGTCLRVRVEIDVTRKLIRGRKINMEKGETRWVHFKYERLPNFCYRCGLLDHDLKDCLEEPGKDKTGEESDLQYGAWLRGEPIRKGGWDFGFAKKKVIGEMKNKENTKAAERKGRDEVQEGVARETQELEAISLGDSRQERHGDLMGGGEVTTVKKGENGLAENIGRSHSGELVEVGEENREVGNGNGGKEACQKGRAENLNKPIPNFEFGLGNETVKTDNVVGLGLGPDKNKDGPMAMQYDPEEGWVANKLGPSSGHWKRIIRAGPDAEMKESVSPVQRKRDGDLIPREIDQNVKASKRRKSEGLSKEDPGDESTMDGGVAVAARQHRRAK